MLPSLFGENFLSRLFDDPFETSLFGGQLPLLGALGQNPMKTDVKELPDAYEICVDLPGFQKNEIHVDLSNGYLTIRASREMSKEEKDIDGHYLRQERYGGACSRSFYVGDIRPDEIHVKYDNGILKLTLPKSRTAALPESTEISIL
ncbi:MAG: Hsp20/alpha crystallin family protein [Clostridium sp.]|uniref:Hsp20/alpha crystallin family protein n=1 Tax=Clostridium sp. TaxID=1506 RepID=UPI002910B60E|nr:Hsp20/alpha crystallin family protein [Clostridium sp.]MDU7339105.1 Hsp20/alpha crystallin family protein [Clostridium sp.]